MPITILNPHRSEPWAHAVQGLSGALEAYTRYKSEDRDYKLKLEEVARRREESEQMRKVRDIQISNLEADKELRARTRDEETESLKQVLGESVEAPLAGLVTRSGGSLAMAPGQTGEAPTLETITPGILTGITPGETVSGPLTTEQTVRGKKKQRDIEDQRLVDLSKRKEEATWIPVDSVPLLRGKFSPGTKLPPQEVMRLTLAAQTPQKRDGFTLGRARYEYDAEGMPRRVAVEPEGVGEGSRSTKSVYDKQSKENVLRTEAQIAAEPDRYIAPKTATATGEGGKPLLGGELTRISEFVQGLETIKSLGPKIAQKGGTGFFQGLSVRVPDFVTEFTGIGATAKGLRANLDLAKQIVGKALEGGVLRKEDEEKYKKILAEVSNAPSLADEKLLGLIDQMSRDAGIYLNTLKKGGRNVSEFEEEIQSYRKQSGKPDPNVDPNDPDNLLSPAEKELRKASGNTLGLKKPGSR